MILNNLCVAIVGKIETSWKNYSFYVLVTFDFVNLQLAVRLISGRSATSHGTESLNDNIQNGMSIESPAYNTISGEYLDAQTFFKYSLTQCTKESKRITSERLAYKTFLESTTW